MSGLSKFCGCRARRALRPAFLFVLAFQVGCWCPPFCPPLALNVVTPSDGEAVSCDCAGSCFFEIQGTLTRALGPDEELFVAVRPLDPSDAGFFVQQEDKTVVETLWTARAQTGSAEYPPEAGDRFEIQGFIVDTAVGGTPPVGPLPALSAAYIPGLAAVSDVHTISVECGVLKALPGQARWHLYSPFREAPGQSVLEAQVRRELQMLYDVGARILVTYEMMNGIEVAPCIAKEIGFRWVLAGVYWYTDGVANGQANSSLDEEKAAIDDNIECIDGIVIGNEGLVNDPDTWNQPRYALADLEGELRAMKAKYPDKVVTTAEGRDVYEEHPHLVSDASLTDFVFPNIHPWWGGFRDPAEAVNDLINTITSDPFSQRGDRPIIMHESWWPSETEGQDENAQAEYFQGMLEAAIHFCWGETIDQPWKEGDPEGSVGPHWGLWHFDKDSDTYQRKKVVDLIEATRG